MVASSGAACTSCWRATRRRPPAAPCRSSWARPRRLRAAGATARTRRRRCAWSGSPSAALKMTRPFWITGVVAASWPSRRGSSGVAKRWASTSSTRRLSPPPRTPRGTEWLMASSGSTAGQSYRARTSTTPSWRTSWYFAALLESRPARHRRDGCSTAWRCSPLHAIEQPVHLTHGLICAQVGQLSRPSMVATLALGTKVGGALCLSGIRPDQCAVLERLYAPCTARRLAVPSRPATPSPRRSRASPVDPRRLRRRREDLPRPGRFWKGVLGLLGEARADAEGRRSEGASGADQRRRRARLM